MAGQKRRSPPDSPAWRALHAPYAEVPEAHLRDLFAGEPERRKRFAAADTGGSDEGE